MSTTFKEKVANFMSYVVFFGFVVGVGVAGYFGYNYLHKDQPAETADTEKLATSANAGDEATAGSAEVKITKPSQILQPVMASNLPLLLNNFDEKPVELLPNLVAAEQLITPKKTEPKPQQKAWLLASQICAEIRKIHAERKLAAASLTKQQSLEISVHQPSKRDLDEMASRQEFFRRAAQARWVATVTPRKKQIDVLYRELLNLEAKAGYQ